jgi:hypothetical protein
MKSKPAYWQYEKKSLTGHCRGYSYLFYDSCICLKSILIPYLRDWIVHAIKESSRILCQRYITWYILSGMHSKFHIKEAI